MCKQIRLILDKNKDCKSIYSNERKNNAVEKKINQTEFMLLKANCKFEISLNKFFAKHATTRRKHTMENYGHNFELYFHNMAISQTFHTINVHTITIIYGYGK